ncbi:MAG: hypothetical protein ABEJ56_05925 [Candidatus Nanohaloarchaea archaeon]
MKLEFFDGEKHSDYWENFVKYAREPNEEQQEFFGELIPEIVGKIEDLTGISADFTLYFASTDETEIQEGATVNQYVHGHSFAGWTGPGIDVVMLRAVRGRENWRECLVNMIAHEMAHLDFYRSIEDREFDWKKNWFQMVFEGHAMNTAEKVTGKLGIDWEPHYRSDNPPEIDSEAVRAKFDEERVPGPESLFQRGGNNCEDAEGYNLSYLLVKDILERLDIKLKELPELDQDQMRDEVVRSFHYIYA